MEFKFLDLVDFGSSIFSGICHNDWNAIRMSVAATPQRACCSQSACGAVWVAVTVCLLHGVVASVITICHND